VTTREQAERLLKEMPEEQVPAALDALQEVKREAAKAVCEVRGESPG